MSRYSELYRTRFDDWVNGKLCAEDFETFDARGVLSQEGWNDWFEYQKDYSIRQFKKMYPGIDTLK